MVRIKHESKVTESNTSLWGEAKRNESITVRIRAVVHHLDHPLFYNRENRDSNLGIFGSIAKKL